MRERLPLANIAGDPMLPGEDHIPPSVARLEGPAHELLKDQVEDVLLSLIVRERRVMRMLYGLDGGGVRTKAAVGRELGVSPRTVGRDEVSLLEKLRHPSHPRTLKDYLAE